ncbi:MAG: multicopper oxidase domain-containing protein, partial [Verrucomicrobiota bacterium]
MTQTTKFTRRSCLERSLSTTKALFTLALLAPLASLLGQPARSGNNLRIPPNWTGGVLSAAPTNQEVWPGFSTSLLAVNGSVPSPTIRVQKGQNFTARIENRLADNLVIHWHGIVAPPAMDGHPKDAVPPGQGYSVDFPIRQRAGTYFYHPHTEPLTGKLVYMGLAGAFIVEDPAEQTLGLPSGNYDVPLLIQDKRLTENRQIVYNPTMMDTMAGFLGDTVLVNGTPDAYLSVDKSLYRFRLVNGSNARVYKLALSNGRPFHIIATDAGLLPAPAQATSAFLAPGQRLELLVDFSTYALGESVQLKSLEFTTTGMGGMGGVTNTNTMGGMETTNTVQTMLCTQMTNQMNGVPLTNGMVGMLCMMGTNGMGGMTSTNGMGGTAEMGGMEATNAMWLMLCTQ